MEKEKTDQNFVWNGENMSREEVVRKLKNNPSLYGRYTRMDPDWRERFLEFCMGRKTLPVTYDPFFKRIFHPDVHPDRLSRLISSLLGVNVKVKGILPAEDSMMDGESLLILDVLAELEDGSLANVEIQKSPYAFPAERMSCYSSDLVMRQYTRTRGRRGQNFTYQDMKKVYTIVIFEKSTSEFHGIPEHYIHHGRTAFDTGLNLKILQEYCLVALDVFRKFPYPKDRSEQTAWLSFLSTEDVAEADRLILEYPWLEEIYRETASLRQNPEEVFGMYSEALRILDRNTVRYMIEEQKKEIEEQKKQLLESQTVIQQSALEIQEKNAAIEEKETALEQQRIELQELRQELERLRREMASMQSSS